MKIKTWPLVVLVLCSAAHILQSQKDTSWYDISALVYLDSLTIVASRYDFNVEDFIQLVQEDKSMERAFQNIRFLSHQFDNDIRFYNSTWKPKSSYFSKNNQTIKDNCRNMEVGKETITGSFYRRNGSYKYYTSSLYDRVFYTHGIVCSDEAELKSYRDNYQAKSRKDKQILELKKIVFNPGQKSEVLLIGDKMEIFSPKMAKFYNFNIKQGADPNGVQCYIFSARVKPKYASTKKVVVQYIESYFEKGSLDILARNYKLKHRNPAFDFDVEMKVELHKFKQKNVPSEIAFKGYWKVTGMKSEFAQFRARLYNFK